MKPIKNTPSPKAPSKKDLLAELEKLTAALKQERADAANLRRRLQQDSLRLSETSRISVLSDLLPLLDNLQRAFQSPPEKLRSHNWVKGVLYIDQQLAVYLQELELEPIVTVGAEFNPNTMEAVETVEDADQAEGLVLEEVLKGYCYKSQVLRPAQVKVVGHSQ